MNVNKIQSFLFWGFTISVVLYFVFKALFILLGLRILAVYNIPLKTFAAMMFYYVTSCVAILSYLRAKDTILAPLRTELFKIQLKELENVISFFSSKDEADYLNILELHRIYDVNFLNMLLEYSEFFAIDLHIDESKVKDVLDSDFPGSLFTKQYYESTFEIVNVGSSHNNSHQCYAREKQLSSLTFDQYIYGHLRLPPSISSINQQLTGWSNNPLLNQRVREQIREFGALVNSSLLQISESITFAAHALPKVVNLVELCKKPISLAHGYFNDYNHNRENFEEAGQEVMKSICDCYKFDDLFR